MVDFNFVSDLMKTGQHRGFYLVDVLIEVLTDSLPKTMIKAQVTHDG